MPTLPTYISTHRADAARMTFHLVKLHFAVPQCLADCDLPILYNGDTYSPAAGLVVGGVQGSQDDRRAVSASIRIGNGSDYWGALLASLSSTQRHPLVQVFEAWLDPAAPSSTPVAVRGLLVGTVEGSAWTPLEAELSVGPSVDARSATLPWRACDTRCTYRKFKGLQCGYAGAATTCDRSFTTCTALGNQARFGGFRKLPESDPAVVSVTGRSPSGYVDIEFSIPKET